MESVFTTITSVVGALTSAATSVVGVIADSPILMIPVGIGIVGAGAGLIRKFKR